MAQCRSCGSEILWIKTESGKSHPVDADPVKMWVEVEPDKWKLLDARLTHFASCVDSKSWSKKNGGSDEA